MSDRELRALQRLYAADPTSGNAGRYIAALERCTGSVSDENQTVFDDPITRHLTLALADNGLITSLDELHNITEIPQLEQLVHYLFPYGGMGDFWSCEFGADDIEFYEGMDDWFHIHTGIWAYRDPPVQLTDFFAGHGNMLQLSKGDEIIWQAPFRRRVWGWWDEVDTHDREAWHQHWLKQGLVYWSPNENESSEN